MTELFESWRNGVFDPFDTEQMCIIKEDVEIIRANHPCPLKPWYFEVEIMEVIPLELCVPYISRKAPKPLLVNLHQYKDDLVVGVCNIHPANTGWYFASEGHLTQQIRELWKSDCTKRHTTQGFPGFPGIHKALYEGR